MAGPATVPLIISLAGSAAQYIASNQAGKKQQRQLNLMAEDREKFGKKNRELTQDLAKQYDPTTRKAVIEGMAGEREGAISADLVKANEALPEAGYTGKVSEGYTTAKAGRVASEAQRRVDLTRLLSQVLGPGDTRTEEGFKTGEAQSQQGTELTNIRALTAGRQSDYAGIEPNPLLMLAGTAAQGVGSGLAYGAYQDKLDNLYKGIFAGAPKAPRVYSGYTPRK